MSCEDETAEALRRAGQKMTPQRLMIVRALRHAEGHVTAAEIAEAVHAEFPYVDVSTVYRTLDVLKRMRLVTSTDIGSGDAVFEWAPATPHHHLVCTSCQGISEIDHHYLESMGERLRADFGFEADLHHFAIFGLCRECQLDEELDGPAA